MLWKKEKWIMVYEEAIRQNSHEGIFFLIKKRMSYTSAVRLTENIGKLLNPTNSKSPPRSPVIVS